MSGRYYPIISHPNQITIVSLSFYLFSKYISSTLQLPKNPSVYVAPIEKIQKY